MRAISIVAPFVLLLVPLVISASSSQDKKTSSNPENRNLSVTREGKTSTIAHDSPSATPDNLNALASALTSEDDKDTFQFRTQTVSASSALWAIIALSLNAMTQRSGADRFPSNDTLSPARTSPIVCLADMVVGGLWLIQGVRRGLSAGASLHWYRREMGLMRESSDRRFIQGVPAVTTIVFLLGPLPQAIKFLGSGGLPGSKSWVTMYLVAWLTEAISRFLAGLPTSLVEETNDIGNTKLNFNGGCPSWFMGPLSLPRL